MGTRNLTVVQLGGEYKVAQYGQWDGYPEGQGVTVLEFLRGADLDKFKIQVAQCRFVSIEDEEDLAGPQFSRNTAAKVLYLIYDGTTDLVDSISFAKDGLFCEWAYVIDLDAGTFEAFEGFKTKAAPGRFGTTEEEYQPVQLVASWPLTELPTKGDFLKRFGLEDEDA